MNRPWRLRDQDGSRRLGRWLLPVSLAILMPKCVLCVLAYAGAGVVAAGFDGVEWCGGRPGVPSVLPTLGAWIGATGLLLVAEHRRRARPGTRRTSGTNAAAGAHGDPTISDRPGAKA